MSKSNPTPLSKAQREIMRLVWDTNEITVSEVRDLLAKRHGWARNTVQTMMSRMEEKGWLRRRVVGRTFLYAAAVPKRTMLGSKVKELVDGLFGGSADEMVTALMEYRGLTKEEADRIRAMLDRTEQSGDRQREATE